MWLVFRAAAGFDIQRIKARINEIEDIKSEFEPGSLVGRLAKGDLARIRALIQKIEES